VAGVVLHVAQGGTGVQSEGDRRVASRVRGELLPCADPGGAGQAAHPCALLDAVDADTRPAGRADHRTRGADAFTTSSGPLSYPNSGDFLGATLC
jgi:hypothetical protein